MKMLATTLIVAGMMLLAGDTGAERICNAVPGPAPHDEEFQVLCCCTNSFGQTCCAYQSACFGFVNGCFCV